VNKIMRTAAAVGLGALTVFSTFSSRVFARAPNAKARPSTATVTLSVEGMTCASCSVAVKTVLKRLDGVKEAKVNLSEKNAVVEYEPAKVKPQQMVDAVNKLGYPANLTRASKD
jgi:periplasmic mercuric ion binding protein